MIDIRAVKAGFAGAMERAQRKYRRDYRDLPFTEHHYRVCLEAPGELALEVIRLAKEHSDRQKVECKDFDGDLEHNAARLKVLIARVNALESPRAAANGDARAESDAASKGIASETEQLEDGGRVLRRVTKYSDGSVYERSHITSTPIYRGTWDRARRYTCGDQVTHRGSVWICNIDALGVSPGDGRCWQLAVKRGRDGR